MICGIEGVCLFCKMYSKIKHLLEEQKCDKKIVNPKLSSDLKARNFIIKEPLAKVFSSEFCEIFKKTFFTELLWTTAPESI